MWAHGGAPPGADGRYLFFVSTVDNLVANCHNGVVADVFVLDLPTGQMTLVSVTPDGSNGGNGTSAWPSVSSDGRWVAFVSAASDLATDGTNGTEDVFVRDLVSGVTRLGSRNGRSFNPVLAGDGQRVIFQSAALDLVRNDVDTAMDVFGWDLVTETTVLVSVDYTNQRSANGGGWNVASDVFSFGLPADTDADGLEDAWEVVHSGDLSLSGIGDEDEDGVSNLAEFIAGTLPDGRDSLLAVTAALGTDGLLTLSWPSERGRRYSLGATGAVSAPGRRDLTGFPPGTGGMMSHSEELTGNGAERFHQVLVAQ